MEAISGVVKGSYIEYLVENKAIPHESAELDLVIEEYYDRAFKEID